MAKFIEWIRRKLGRCPYCGFGKLADGSVYCDMCGRHLETGKRYDGK